MSLKTIKATVGASGVNIPADVATVQFLLNCIPVSQGGPQQELYVDGIAGNSTIKAIKRFQQFHTGQSSGQISANDLTLNQLKRFDPLPSTAWVVPPDFKPTPYVAAKSRFSGNISIKIDTIKGKAGNISHEGFKRESGNDILGYKIGDIKGLKIDTIKGKTR